MCYIHSAVNLNLWNTERVQEFKTFQYLKTINRVEMSFGFRELLSAELITGIIDPDCDGMIDRTYSG